MESQEQVATNRLVATLAEQDLLESMLEASKPPLPKGTARLDYLLATPFRYPPLPHGSRFGGRHEPSLFYAGVTAHYLQAVGATLVRGRMFTEREAETRAEVAVVNVSMARSLTTSGGRAGGSRGGRAASSVCSRRRFSTGVVRSATLPANTR